MGLRNSKILLVVLFLGVSASFNVSAQSLTEKDEWLGKVFDQYATIAGGWWLESRCDFLSEHLKHEFEWHVAQITGWITKRSNPEFYLSIQSAARRTVESEYSECDKKSNDIVVRTLLMARALSGNLSGQPYEPGVSYAQYTLKRYFQVAIAIDVVMKECDHLNSDPPFRSDIIRVFDSVSNHLKSKYPEPMKKISVELNSLKSKFKTSKCGGDTQKFVLTSLKDLRKMEYFLGLRAE